MKTTTTTTTKTLYSLAMAEQHDAQRDHFPFCIVWSPIPCLTWILPFVGHLGIATSEGIINDFIGPYMINEDPKRTGFGVVTRYIPVRQEELYIDCNNKTVAWDVAVKRASEKYKGMMHNLILNNCHSHVACALDEVHYKNFTGWNTFLLILLMFFRGKHVSVGRSLYTFLPFLFLSFCFALLLFFGFITLSQ